MIEWAMAHLAHPAKLALGYCILDISTSLPKIRTADWPMGNYLDSQYIQQFFSLSLQHNDLLIYFLSLAL